MRVKRSERTAGSTPTPRSGNTRRGLEKRRKRTGKPDLAHKKKVAADRTGKYIGVGEGERALRVGKRKRRAFAGNMGKISKTPTSP